MTNINKVKKTLKSFLKGKVSITKKVTILFLIAGVSAFAGYNNAALPSWINASEIPGSWVFTNMEPNNAKTITGDNNIVLGRFAGGNISGSHNFVAGHNGAGGGTTGINNILMGQEAGVNTAGHNNVALGDRAGKNVTGNNNFAAGPFGAGTGVTGYYNIALGNETGQNVGYAGNVPGLESSNNNTGMGRNNVAIGRKAGNSVQGNENVAIGARVGEGVGSKATTNSEGIYNIVVGVESGNNTQGVSNVALGRNAGNNVDGSYNFAVGPGAGNGTKGSNNIFMGENAGVLNGVIANHTISIGGQTKALKDKVIAIGYGAQAKELKTVALGGNAITDVENSVSLGNDTDTEGTANTRTKGTDNTYTTETISNKLSLNFAGGDQVVGVVSVGNSNQTRRIQNVAPGLISSTSTDAINGSQLYALAEKVANIEITAGGASPVLSFTGDNIKTTSDAIGKVDLGTQKLAINGTDGKIKTEVAKDGQSVTINLDDAITNTIAAKADKSEIKTYVVENGKNTVVTKDESTSGTVKFTVDAEKTVVVAGTGLKMVSEVAATKDNNYVNTYTLGLADEVVNKIDGKADKTDIAKTTLTVTDGKVADLEDANKTKLVTADTVKDAINNTGFFINSGKTEGENTGANKTLVKAGEEVKLIAGKNVTIAQSGKEFTFSVDLPEISKIEVKAEENSAITVTKDANKDVYTVGVNVDNDTIVIQDGKLKAIIPSIEPGTITDEVVEGNKLAKTDEPNKYATAGTVVNAINTLGNNTIKLAGNSGETNTQNLNKDGGIKFAIEGNGLVKTEAKEDKVIIDLSDEAKEKLNKIENVEKSTTSAISGVASAVAMANLPQVSNIAGHRHNIAG
ncbi:hypothetical protein HP397_05900, partial [Streptobacillus felis]|nr:hypothetical protein [Streptobacillus felis]